MKALYTKIQERLFSDEAKTKFTEAGVKPVKSIDFYKQQYLFQESFELMYLPAVFIEFDILYTTDKQVAEANITLHICYEQIRETSGRMKVTKNNALKFFDFVDVVHDLVKNLESDCTGKLELVSENQDKNDAIINVHLLTFKSSYTGRMNTLNSNYDFTEENTTQLKTNSGLVKEFGFDVS